MTYPSLLIVTGAHLDAELHDRPLAYALLEESLALSPGSGIGAHPLVCSDLWYLNHDDLRSLPTISVGAPEHNALSAYLAARLDSVFVIDGVLMVQMRIDDATPIACCWGIDPPSTARSVAEFRARFLREFLGVGS